MRWTATEIAGLWVIDPEPRTDDRGAFARVFDAAEFVERDLDPSIAQMNLSTTHRAGTFRGFHWQEPPHGEAKTVRCVAGAVWNVVVDVRPGSTTEGRWFGVELTPTNLRMLRVPEGVANGFLTLADDTTILYHVSTPYSPGGERGLRHDDPSLAIDWPRPVEIVSDKDAAWPDRV